MSAPVAPPKQGVFSHLYVRVLAGVLFGILTGYLFPAFGQKLKPLGDAFISLIRMLVGPVVFCTIVHGAGAFRNLKEVGTSKLNVMKE